MLYVNSDLHCTCQYLLLCVSCIGTSLVYVAPQHLPRACGTAVPASCMWHSSTCLVHVAPRCLPRKCSTLVLVGNPVPATRMCHLGTCFMHVPRRHSPLACMLGNATPVSVSLLRRLIGPVSVRHRAPREWCLMLLQTVALSTTTTELCTPFYLHQFN